MRIVFIPVASPLHDEKAVQELIHQYKEGVKDVDSFTHLITSEEDVQSVNIRQDDVTLIGVLTGGTEHLILAIAKRVRATALLPHPTQNSLPASIEAQSRLSLSGYSSVIIKEWPPEASVRSYVKAWKAVSSLKNYVFGLLGQPSPWLVYSSGHDIEKELEERLGISFKFISLNEVYRQYRLIDEDEARELAVQITSRAVDVEVPMNEVIKSVKLYLAIRKILEKEGIKAFTIRCFDIIKSLDTTACLPLALLNSKGFVAGCEGDVPALLSMVVLKELTGKPGFMGNIAWVKNNRFLLAHCTVPLDLPTKYKLRTHFESGRGVGISGIVEEGVKVTLVRIDPLTQSMRVVKGKVISGFPQSNQHCRTQLWIESSDSIKLVTEPIGNHYVLIYGDYYEVLKWVAEAMDLYLL